jgi:hypothetical protein
LARIIAVLRAQFFEFRLLFRSQDIHHSLAMEVSEFCHISCFHGSLFDRPCYLGLGSFRVTHKRFDTNPGLRHSGAPIDSIHLVFQPQHFQLLFLIIGQPELISEAHEARPLVTAASHPLAMVTGWLGCHLRHRTLAVATAVAAMVSPCPGGKYQQGDY